MARPSYLVKNKSGDEQIVKSKDLAAFQADGFEIVRKATVAEAEQGAPSEPVPAPEPTPEREVIDPSYKPEIETQEPETVEVPETDDIEVSVAGEKEVETKPKKAAKKPAKKTAKKGKLVCPHCNVTARSQASYDKNHGDNCLRAPKK